MLATKVKFLSMAPPRHHLLRVTFSVIDVCFLPPISAKISSGVFFYSSVNFHWLLLIKFNVSYLYNVYMKQCLFFPSEFIYNFIFD